MTTEITLDPRQLGYAAYEADSENKNNPYHEADIVRYNDWDGGWREAKRDAAIAATEEDDDSGDDRDDTFPFEGAEHEFSIKGPSPLVELNQDDEDLNAGVPEGGYKNLRYLDAMMEADGLAVDHPYRAFLRVHEYMDL